MSTIVQKNVLELKPHPLNEEIYGATSEPLLTFTIAQGSQRNLYINCKDVKPMDLSKIKPINLYQLSLLNVEYIDFDNSVINSDGTVNIMLDTQKVPKPTFAVNIDDWVFENLSDSDECYIKFNPEPGEPEGLYVEYYAVLHKYDFVYTTTLFFMRELNHPEYIKYANMYDEFNSKVMEWLKSRIRNVIEKPKGDFVSDKIDQDTYFQQREYNHSDIYYIIYQWWNKVINNHVDFINATGSEKGSVFIALND